MQIAVVFDKFYSASRLFLIFLHRMTVRKADFMLPILKRESGANPEQYPLL